MPHFIRAILTAIIVGLLMSASFAQFKSKEPPKDPAATSEKKKPDDRDYKAAIERLPDQKYDPWRQMR